MGPPPGRALWSGAPRPPAPHQLKRLAHSAHVWEVQVATHLYGWEGCCTAQPSPPASIRNRVWLKTQIAACMAQQHPQHSPYPSSYMHSKWLLTDPLLHCLAKSGEPGPGLRTKHYTLATPFHMKNNKAKTRDSHRAGSGFKGVGNNLWCTVGACWDDGSTNPPLIYAI